MDEFIMGHGKEVQIEIKDKTVAVRGFERGIPNGVSEKLRPWPSRDFTGSREEVLRFRSFMAQL